MIKNKEHVQTVRDLTSTSILFKELLNRTERKLTEIVDYQRSLGQLQHKLDSLMADSALFYLPGDSAALVLFYKRLLLIKHDIDPVKIPLKNALDSVERLEDVILHRTCPLFIHAETKNTGNTGRMKSIGLRSSVVTTWDGADVIIPNGDLLNQHLVNWTLGNSIRRYDLKLGVAYGTDLQMTQSLLLDLMLLDQRILKNPKPFVLVSEFGKSSIDFVLKFWVPHFSIGLEVKSDLIVNIDKMFKEHGIVIPFPQQDVHLKTHETIP